MGKKVDQLEFWADGEAGLGRVAQGGTLHAAPLSTSFDSFLDAAAGATPRGIVLVEEAIDRAIAAIDRELVELKPEEFEAEAFIPLVAFGEADRSPELAVHHTRAHAVMTATLMGVRSDLEHFKLACELARRDILQADEDMALDLTRFQRLLADIGLGLPNRTEEAYDKAMDDAGDIDLEAVRDSDEPGGVVPDDADDGGDGGTTEQVIPEADEPGSGGPTAWDARPFAAGGLFGSATGTAEV